MVPYIGDFAEDEEIYHYFNTFDSNKPSASVTITDLADTDIFVYKDGNITDLVTDGASVVIDFDGRTGVHKITIDTSAHADYATGSDYMVLVNGTTVDAATVTAALFTFSIENRYMRGTNSAALAADYTSARAGYLDTINTNLDATVSSRLAASAAPTNFGDLAITVTTGQVTVGTNNDKTGYSISGTKTTLDALTDITAAQVNTEVDSAIVTYGLDHLVSAAAVGTDVVDNSIVAKLVSKSATADFDDFVNTTDSLQAIRDEGSANWVTGAGGSPPQLMQSTTITGLVSQTVFDLTAGSADNDAYNGCVVVITDASTSTQKAHGTVSDYAGATKTITLAADPLAGFVMANGDTIDIMSPLGSAGSAPTAAAIATEVWDRDATGHQTTGTFGQAIGDPGANTETMYDAVVTDATGINVATDVAEVLVDTAVIGAAGAGLTEAGGTGDQFNAIPTDSALATAAELAKVPKSDGAITWNATALGDINIQADLALTDYDPPTKAELDTATANLDATVSSRMATTHIAATAGVVDNVNAVDTQVTANMTAVNGDATAASNLEATMETVLVGTVSGAGSTASTVDTGLTGYDNDTFNGRVLLFRTGALQYEAGAITDYDSTSGTFTFATDEFTTGASNTDQFVIV